MKVVLKHILSQQHKNGKVHNRVAEITGGTTMAAIEVSPPLRLRYVLLEEEAFVVEAAFVVVPVITVGIV